METHAIYGQVLLETHPSARGFFPVSPVPDTDGTWQVYPVLVLTYLMNMLTESSASVVQSLGTIAPELPAYIEITVLLIAPIGIFLFFIFIGDATQPCGNLDRGRTDPAPEWYRCILPGIYSAVYRSCTTPYLLALFQWIAYLVQPASVVAAVLVLLGTELFRRSVRYTLYGDMVRITGGSLDTG